MRLRSPRSHLAGLLAAILVAACGGERRAGPISVTDDAGRAVTLAGPAQRVVSLLPSFTELVYALGAGDRLVGRTTWCDYPPDALTVPSVGDGLTPNLEAVAQRRPDLVLLYRSAQTETAAAQLERLGIGAALLRVDRLEDVARAARLVGRLVGREVAGDSLAGALERIAADSGPTPLARVAFIVWDNPPIVIGAGSYLDQLARLAGGENVFADVTAPSAQVSLETIARRDPDVLLVLSDTAEIPAYGARREWQAVRAVRERRFAYLPGSLFGRPGPRAAEAVREFRSRLEGAR